MNDGLDYTSPRKVIVRLDNGDPKILDRLCYPSGGTETREIEGQKTKIGVIELNYLQLVSLPMQRRYPIAGYNPCLVNEKVEF